MKTLIGKAAVVVPIGLAGLLLVVLLSPHARQPQQPEPAPSTVSETLDSREQPAPTEVAIINESQASFATVVVTRTSRFLWPASGPISSYFGLGHPNGIDIALDVNADSPIFASASGLVQFAGGDACCEYGLYVVLDHDNEMSTLYGHLSRVDVAEGQRVQQGQQLGLGGSTGKADGKHLHYELLSGASWVDPLRYLPYQRDAIGLTETSSCAGKMIALTPDSHVTLDFASATLAGFALDTAMLEAAGISQVLEIQDGRPDSPLEVSFDVPPLARANGEVRGYQLKLDFSKDGLSEFLTCKMSLATNRTLPNPPVARIEVLRGTPTPRPPTPTPSPTPTPTPITLYKVLTPQASPTPGKRTPTPAAAADGEVRPAAPPPVPPTRTGAAPAQSKSPTPVPTKPKPVHFE